ncbi:type III pantothenate kinase [Porcincola intestinalis]|uniref:type III pantothenate kinase n=1 Tax=Porcincola intestinalis TaxID=2606632 RepID=UPI0023F147B6|nr:type III pantothenate kinase [Porcincola intestinalis]MCI6697787.1 type III pantothenate kinase [Lachnospiraceae bacterium]MCI6766670.1 type III pantothenate kinase [Lachnospiraceae bacterium]MDD7060952.1 type III pantothenate kinase [Porcincola intestinalis]MDY4204026.1 type III pantothenate kinase [Porcincola intestinalis]MDY5283383.1 type III pantothenate kinase [Porcincola intestinalis]
MLLAIDIGNTNTVLGGYEGWKAIFTERISTDTSKTSLEYAILFKTALDLHGVDVSMIDGAIIGSVVPPLTYIVRTALKKVCGVQAYVVGPGLKTGLNIRMDDPTSIGADLIAGAVGALAKFDPPLMVIDMGTATTMIVIDETRSYVGGMIMTGLRLSLDALVKETSMLQGISLEVPKKVIGKNTADAMRSGLLYGNAAMIDGLIDRVEAETGTQLQVVATGGLAGTVIGACTHDITLVRTLVLDGLVEIYHKNTKSGADAKSAGALV